MTENEIRIRAHVAANVITFLESTKYADCLETTDLNRWWRGENLQPELHVSLNQLSLF